MGRAANLGKDWETAESLYAACLDGYRQSLGDSHPKTLRAELETIQAMRHFEYQIGSTDEIWQWEKATIAEVQEPLYEAFLGKVIQLLGKNDPLAWQTRQYYADCLSLKTWLADEGPHGGDWSMDLTDRAREQLELVAESQAATLGSLHPTTLSTRKTLPFLYNPTKIGTTNTLGRRAVAELEEILQAEVSIWGENHPSVEETCIRLGKLYFEYGFPDRVREHYERAIQIHKRLHPEPDKALADLYFRLWVAQGYYRRKPEAVEAADKGLDVVRALKLSPEEMMRYRDMEAGRHATSGDLIMAEAIFREMDYNMALVDLYFGQDRREDAFNEVDKLLEEIIETKGTRHTFDLRWTYLKLSNFCLNRGMHEEALRYAEEAEACWRMTREGDPRLELIRLSATLEPLIALGRYEEARAILQEQLPETPEPEPLPEGEELTYTGAIGPILTARCGNCHGTSAMQGLDITTYESLMTGGNSGPVLVAGDPDNSLIVTKISGDTPHFAQLSSDELQALIDWILAGAEQ